MNTKNKIRSFLVVTMGPGETSQGAAFAKYLFDRKQRVTFILLLKENLHFVEDLKFRKIVTDSGDNIKKEISSGKYDAVILCNSKMMKKDQNFQKNPPEKKPLVVSIDSNWLFNQKQLFPIVNWIDYFFLNLPEDVFKFGQKQFGGNYFIPEAYRKKIFTAGLLPSYEKITLKEKDKIRSKLLENSGQKLIFCYIGSGVTFRKDLYPKVIEIFDLLDKNLKGKFKVLYLSENAPKKNWTVLPEGITNTSMFYQYLSSSDLVFQHQGLGTLEQSIAANIPVVSLVSPPEEPDSVHQHAWEVLPFERAGLCKMFNFNQQNSDIVTMISDLLYIRKNNKAMVEAQKRHYNRGEEYIYNKILELLK